MSYEKELTVAEAKVHYIFEIVKQVRWSNESDFDNFKLAVIGRDKDLISALEKRKEMEIRGKKITVINPSSLDFPVNEYSIIFITKRKRAVFSSLFERDEQTLLVSEGRTSSDERMISLELSDERMHIKLNRANLAQKGFSTSVNLLEMAGTKDDLSEQLREREASYRNLLIQVRSKEKKLAELNATLVENRQTLEAAKQELVASEKALASSQKSLSSLAKQENQARLQSEANQKELNKQKNEITQKQSEIAEKIASIVRMERAIESNNRVLQTQMTKISNQRSTIKIKEATISEQRWLIIVGAVSVFIFSLLIYWLIRSNRLRERANQELTQLNSKLYEMATTDYLSKLSNRRHFFETSQKELLRAK
jgi:chromosome segregation ATPase